MAPRANVRALTTCRAPPRMIEVDRTSLYHMEIHGAVKKSERHKNGLYYGCETVRTPYFRCGRVISEKRIFTPSTVRLPLLDCSNSRRHIALSRTTFYHFSGGLKNVAHVTGATPEN